MNRIATVLICMLMVSLVGHSTGTSAEEKPTEPIPWPVNMPVYDHIVIVIEENKDYDQIIDNPAAPFINKTLRA